jgi:hypothetical protein
MAFEFLNDIQAKDIGLLAAGIVGGGIASWLVAKKFIHRPHLKFSLKPAAILRKSDFGRTFKMSANGNNLDNLCVFNLDMHLKGKSDLSRDQVPEDNKPTLFFSGFTIYDVRTIEYDETRFSIPLAIAANGSLLIVNIDRMRANTHASFQIIGSFRDSTINPEDFLADFYPGSLHNVDIGSAGHIRRPWKKSKGERQA